MLSIAWKKVSSKAIKQCWTKAGFVLAEESSEVIKVNKYFILSSPSTRLTKEQFKNWLSIDGDTMIAPDTITEEDKLDEIVDDIQQSEKETEGDEGGDSIVNID